MYKTIYYKQNENYIIHYKWTTPFTFQTLGFPESDL